MLAEIHAGFGIFDNRAVLDVGSDFEASHRGDLDDVLADGEGGAGVGAGVGDAVVGIGSVVTGKLTAVGA